MHHDFAAQHGGDGGPCDRKGIMSYAGPMQGFSACSKKDFEQTYANKNWGNGCLEDISGMGLIARHILENYLLINIPCQSRK